MDNEKVDEMVLARLSLTMFSDHGGTRAWKGFPWEVMDRLHAKGIHIRSEVNSAVSLDE